MKVQELLQVVATSTGVLVLVACISDVTCDCCKVTGRTLHTHCSTLSTRVPIESGGPLKIGDAFLVLSYPRLSVIRANSDYHQGSVDEEIKL
jgi:hypothetical protein